MLVEATAVGLVLFHRGGSGSRVDGLLVAGFVVSLFQMEDVGWGRGEKDNRGSDRQDGICSGGGHS